MILSPFVLIIKGIGKQKHLQHFKKQNFKKITHKYIRISCISIRM